MQGGATTMKSPAPMPYEPPSITTYGTVRDLTLGNGVSSNPDVQGCVPAGFNATTPSGIICKSFP